MNDRQSSPEETRALLTTYEELAITWDAERQAKKANRILINSTRSHAQMGARLARVIREVRIHRDRVEIEPRLGATATCAKLHRRSGGSTFVEPNTREA